ncbi:hypothetical protein [Salegentibacter salarius]|uniref:NadR/Ttd14 AAA domain-containing protein n=1 Tax=Salegentibacter salarius TaxID=435906 RepID=A0A2N0U582_9FLAO|nr:hypothetical protein [Salegentibacter salarius]OEY73972.1 hypothetical protein BHS39_00670 [Salegentibacter salarius]PKD22172.1 hypothetical protein APR40_00670 [Salegentibacter salarius]SLJ86279.1 hypothetical protein SAMN05660445_00118 [Salegentibacter salarius]
MSWIELLGPSGIGKSTFLSLLQKNRVHRVWVTEQEALKEIISKKNYRGLKQKALQYYLNQNFINFHKSYLQDLVLQKEQAYEAEAYKYNAIIRLFFHFLLQDEKLLAELGEREWSEKAYWNCWYKSLIGNLCVFNYYKFEKPIVVDEGVIQNNPYIFYLDKTYKGKLPKGLIFIKSDVESIYENLIHRKNDIGKRRIHKNMDENSLKIFINQELENYSKKLDFAKKLNIPYIEIDFSHAQEENIKRANGFLNQLA